MNVLRLGISAMTYKSSHVDDTIVQLHKFIQTHRNKQVTYETFKTKRPTAASHLRSAKMEKAD